MINIRIYELDFAFTGEDKSQLVQKAMYWFQLLQY